MERIIAIGSTSTGVVYGNVGHAIGELIKLQFPQDLFKDYHVSSEIGYRSIKKFLGSNTYTEMKKKEKPYLVVQPQFSSQDTGEFLNNSPIGKNIISINGGIDKRYLAELINDPENGYRVLYRINHDKISYECRIVVSTLNEQLDIYNNMRNMISWEVTGYHLAALESLIPRSVIRQIAALCRLDIDKPEQIAPLLRRMNAHSKHPITYKVKNSSSVDEFFMYYMHNILVTFTDLDRGTVNRKNMVDDYYEINFRVEVEFNMPAVYFVEANNKKALDLQVDLSVVNPTGDSEFIPLYTIKNIYSEYPPILNGKDFYVTIAFSVSEDGKKDELDISDALIDVEDDKDLSLHRILSETVSHGMDPGVMISLYLAKDNVKLEEGTDFTFDARRQVIEITNLDKYATYRLFIYTDNLFVNSRREKYHTSKKTDRPRL